MGKGSARRPTLVPEDEAQKNWDRIFPPKPRPKYEPPPLNDEKPTETT